MKLKSENAVFYNATFLCMCMLFIIMLHFNAFALFLMFMSCKSVKKSLI